MFEARRLQRVLYNLRHFDDALLEVIRTALLAGCVSNERRLALAIGNVLRLSGLDFTVDQFLKCEPRLLGRCLDFLLGRSFHQPTTVIKVFSVRKRNEILELRLHKFAFPLALSCNRIISYVAFAINLQSKSVSR